VATWLGEVMPAATGDTPDMTGCATRMLAAVAEALGA